MSRPVEQALHNLIPRLSGPLPDELVDLANSLLAQSRTKASSLSKEEEPARAYACAHLACERYSLLFKSIALIRILTVSTKRSKTSLNLPPVEPRPPLAPRLYNKLYAYLEQNLAAGTPRKRQRTSQQPLASNGVQNSLPQRHTPTKERALENWRNVNRVVQNNARADDDDRELPSWIVYVIRLLCRQMQTRKAIPHVIAGVESVLFLNPPSQAGTKGKKKAAKEGQIPALIAAIWFFVSCRMLGADLNGEEYVHRRNVVLDVFNEMEEDETLTYKLSTDKSGKTWESIGEKELRLWMNELVEEKWVDQDWFMNIEKGELDGVMEELEGESEVQWYSTRSVEELRKAGLGNMTIRKYDFTSEENRLAYKKWRKLMLIKVEELIRDGTAEEPV